MKICFQVSPVLIEPKISQSKLIHTTKNLNLHPQHDCCPDDEDDDCGDDCGGGDGEKKCSMPCMESDTSKDELCCCCSHKVWKVSVTIYD